MTAPLLIVGAGPVGLTAALELTRRGRRVRVLERRREREPTSRALAVNPRSLELLQACGATDRLLAQGLPIHGLRVVKDGRPLAGADFAQLRHPYPYMLGLPQRRTEAILENLLAERGVPVERGVEALGVTQDDAAARLTVRREAGEETLEAPLLLAADGAHSTLRKALGLGFPGRRDEETFRMIDAEVAWAQPHDRVSLLLDDHRLLACIPLPEAGCWRFIAVEEDPAARLERHGRLLREDWRSAFQVSYRRIGRMSVGRVHFAGDAAHVHSPIGARGMNLGMEDACVFAQCVAEDRLADYGPARHAVAGRVLRLTENFTDLVTARAPLTRWLRDTLGFRLLKLPPLRDRAIRGATGLDHPNPVRG